jgi:hypothetical protein
MAYFKYFPYLFLIIAVLFIVEAISRYNSNEGGFWPLILLAVGAIAMFFIRRHSYKRYNNPKK